MDNKYMYTILFQKQIRLSPHKLKLLSNAIRPLSVPTQRTCLDSPLSSGYEFSGGPQKPHSLGGGQVIAPWADNELGVAVTVASFVSQELEIRISMSENPSECHVGGQQSTHSGRFMFYFFRWLKMAIVIWRKLQLPVLKHSGHQKQGFPEEEKSATRSPRLYLRKQKVSFRNYGEITFCLSCKLFTGNEKETKYVNSPQKNCQCFCIG